MRNLHMHLMLVAAMLASVGVALCLFSTGWQRLWGVASVVGSLACLAGHSFWEDHFGQQQVENFRKQQDAGPSTDEESDASQS